MICTNCGHSMEEDTVLCEFCGASVGSVAEPLDNQQEIPPVADAVPVIPAAEETAPLVPAPAAAPEPALIVVPPVSTPVLYASVPDSANQRIASASAPAKPNPKRRNSLVCIVLLIIAGIGLILTGCESLRAIINDYFFSSGGALSGQKRIDLIFDLFYACLPIFVGILALFATKARGLKAFLIAASITIIVLMCYSLATILLPTFSLDLLVSSSSLLRLLAVFFLVILLIGALLIRKKEKI